ncbi:MAG: enoyl-CoA hydratase/isomerase family protein [Burkholderiaceae bacterium]|nr:enoyl-CoA hydratase/isomerase family protein [Burkholderiaceae bacterium]
MNAASPAAEPFHSFKRVIEGRVEVYQDGAVALIRMNRPDKRNALDAEQIAALDKALGWLAQAQDVNAAVLTGSQEAFCAGGDIAMFLGVNPDTAWNYTRRGYDLLRPVETGRKPLIAAVNGYCLAGGLEIALACDFIIAGSSASFGLAEVDLGLIPGWGGTVRIGAAIPVRVARQIVMTCERLNAERARSLGLVNEVLPDEASLARAIELARHIARQPPLAVQAAKAVLNATEGGSAVDTALALEGSLSSGLFSTSAVKQRVQQWVDRARSKAKA